MSIPFLSATPPPFEDGGHVADDDDFGDFSDHLASSGVAVSSCASAADDNIFFKPIERVPSIPHTSEQDIDPTSSVADRGLSNNHPPQGELNIENDNGSDEEDWSEFGSVAPVNPDPAFFSTDVFGKFSSTASTPNVDPLEFKAAESFSTDSGGSNDADTAGLETSEMTHRKNYNIPPPYENQSNPEDDQNEVEEIFQNPSSPINAAIDADSENSSSAAEPYSEDGSIPAFAAAAVQPQPAEDGSHSAPDDDFSDEFAAFAEAPGLSKVADDSSGEISQTQMVVVSCCLDSAAVLPDLRNSVVEDDAFSEFASVPTAVDMRMTSAADENSDLLCIPADESEMALSSVLDVEDVPSSPADSDLEEPDPATQKSTPPDDLEEEENFKTFKESSFRGNQENESGEQLQAAEHRNEISDGDENFQTFQEKSMFNAAQDDLNCPASTAEKIGSSDDNCNDGADEDEFHTFQESTVVGQLDVPAFPASPASETCVDEPQDVDDFDDFEEFKTATEAGGELAVAGTEGGDWAAFGEKNSTAADVDDWAAFQEPKPAETTKSTVAADNILHAQVPVAPFTSSLSQSFLSQSLLTCFAQAAKSDGSSEVTPFYRLLTERNSGAEMDSKAKRPADHGVDIWNGLKVMENTPALKYQWHGSRSSELLLKAINVDARNILTGHRKPSAPVFAANLGLLEPKKAMATSDRLISAAATTSVIQDTSWRSNVDSRSTAGRTVDVRKQEKELLDVLQLNDVGSAPTAKTRSTSLDTILKAITSSSSSSSSAITAVPMSTVRRLDGSTEPLSAEASTVLARLPDLSFMHAKVLMFPVGDCAN